MQNRNAGYNSMYSVHGNNDWNTKSAQSGVGFHVSISFYTFLFRHSTPHLVHRNQDGWSEAC